MGRIVMITLLNLALILSCSKKEAAVKSNSEQDPPVLLAKGTELYNQGDVNGALEQYEIIYNRYPTSREYINAVIGMARCQNDLGDFEQGFDLLYNLIRENMIPTRVPEIYNEMARYYEVTAAYSTEAGISSEQDDYKKAIDYYQKAVKYPNSDDKIAKSYAQFRIGELQFKLKNYKDAALAYQSTIYKYPDSEWAQMAGTRIEEIKQSGQQVLSTLKTEEPSKLDSGAASSDTTQPVLENIESIPADTTLETD